MKKIKYPILCLFLLQALVNSGQKPGPTTDPSKTWKATFRYYMDEELFSMNYDNLPETPVFYPYVAIRQMDSIGQYAGNVFPLIRSLYNGVGKGKRLLHPVNIFSRGNSLGIAPAPSTDKGFSDSAFLSRVYNANDENGQPLYVHLTDSDIVSVLLYQEWAYNNISHQIDVLIPDVCFISKVYDPEDHGRLREGMFYPCAIYEFCQRSSDSIKNPTINLDDPGVVWANGFDVDLKRQRSLTNIALTGDKKITADSTGNTSTIPRVDTSYTYSDVYPLKKVYDRTLAQQLFTDAVNGKLECAQFDNYDPGSVGGKLSAKEVQKAASFPYDPPIDLDAPVRFDTLYKRYPLSDIMGIIVEQEMEFDPVKFTFTSKIKRAAIMGVRHDYPSMSVPIDEQRRFEKKSQIGLFWVLFK